MVKRSASPKNGGQHIIVRKAAGRAEVPVRGETKGNWPHQASNDGKRGKDITQEEEKRDSGGRGHAALEPKTFGSRICRTERPTLKIRRGMQKKEARGKGRLRDKPTANFGKKRCSSAPKP